MSDLPLAGQLDQIERTDAALARFDGRPRHPFRPPCGVLPLNLLWHYARHRRAIAYWSYDSHDYQRLPPEQLAPSIRADPPVAGDVVLMHDDNADTVDLLATLLPEWRQQGYAIRALPELRA
jgi:peptidoglycan/xylan/chitin deacetylase (PgdA/CDA1 family)